MIGYCDKVTKKDKNIWTNKNHLSRILTRLKKSEYEDKPIESHMKLIALSGHSNNT